MAYNVDDFAYDPITKTFDAQNTSTDIIGTVVLLLTMKKKSIALSGEKTVYPGDWPFDPMKGSNGYEVKTITDENIKSLEKYTVSALQPLIDTGTAEIISATASKKDKINRVAVAIKIITTSGDEISYTHFYEVG